MLSRFHTPEGFDSRPCYYFLERGNVMDIGERILLDCPFSACAGKLKSESLFDIAKAKIEKAKRRLMLDLGIKAESAEYLESAQEGLNPPTIEQELEAGLRLNPHGDSYCPVKASAYSVCTAIFLPEAKFSEYCKHEGYDTKDCQGGSIQHHDIPVYGYTGDKIKYHCGD